MNHVSTIFRAADEAGAFTNSTHDAELVWECDPEALKWFGLRRGAVVTFETVETEVETEMVREYRYGYDGQKVERQKSRTENVTHRETRKLRSRSGELYWDPVE